MCNAAVFRVGWFVAKMEAEDLSGARIVWWVEPGLEGLTHSFMMF